MATKPRSKRTLIDLAQIRALAVPLRLRILGALVTEPRTTKQVAELLGEKPTKLYHHVQAMERAQLVRLVHTRPKRGTVEKYYQATATLFEAGPTVFSVAAGARRRQSDRGALLAAVLETAREDLSAYFASPDVEPRLASGARLLIGTSSAKTRAAARRHIEQILDKTAVGAPRRTYSLTIVLCPLTTKTTPEDATINGQSSAPSARYTDRPAR
jgi:DNA-binding transcriptional ArsR family regulator